jgi:hypothetical protein
VKRLSAYTYCTMLVPLFCDHPASHACSCPKASRGAKLLIRVHDLANFQREEHMNFKLASLVSLMLSSYRSRIGSSERRRVHHDSLLQRQITPCLFGANLRVNHHCRVCSNDMSAAPSLRRIPRLPIHVRYHCIIRLFSPSTAV